MNLSDKLNVFKTKGWTYDSETGEVYSHTGKNIRGTSGDYVYCTMNLGDKIIAVTAHQLGFYLHYKRVPTLIDHIDRDSLNNRIDNLREVTQQQNAWNREAKGYSYYEKYGKYMAAIRKDRKQTYLGYFNTAEEAHNAYMTAKAIYHKI